MNRWNRCERRVKERIHRWSFGVVADSHALAYVRVIYFPNWNDEDLQIESTCWATPRTKLC